MNPARDIAARRYEINGIKLIIIDQLGSRSTEWIAQELARDDYGVARIDFSNRDVVIDVGAHVGMFAIYVAKLFPQVSIFAFEPDPLNFKNLEINLLLNRITNVVPSQKAVTADGFPVHLVSQVGNSGGTSQYGAQKGKVNCITAESTTLDEVFEGYDLQKCKLLKVDCEGSEYEILTETKVLSKVEWLSVEIHINDQIQTNGHSVERLLSTLRQAVNPLRLNLVFNRFARDD